MASAEQQAFRNVFEHLYHSRDGLAGTETRLYLNAAYTRLLDPESQIFSHTDSATGNTLYCKYTVITDPDEGFIGLVDFQMEQSNQQDISWSCHISWLHEAHAGEKGWIGEWIYEKKNNAVSAYTIIPKDPLVDAWRQQFLLKLLTNSPLTDVIHRFPNVQSRNILTGHSLLQAVQSSQTDPKRIHKIMDYARWTLDAKQLLINSPSDRHMDP